MHLHHRNFFFSILWYRTAADGLFRAIYISIYGDGDHRDQTSATPSSASPSCSVKRPRAGLSQPRNHHPTATWSSTARKAVTQGRALAVFSLRFVVTTKINRFSQRQEKKNQPEQWETLRCWRPTRPMETGSSALGELFTGDQMVLKIREWSPGDGERARTKPGQGPRTRSPSRSVTRAAQRQTVMSPRAPTKDAAARTEPALLLRDATAEPRRQRGRHPHPRRARPARRSPAAGTSCLPRGRSRETGGDKAASPPVRVSGKGEVRAGRPA